MFCAVGEKFLLLVVSATITPIPVPVIVPISALVRIVLVVGRVFGLSGFLPVVAF